MDLGSTQPLTKMSTRNISWGKGGRCVRLTTYYHPVPLSRNLGTLTSWNPLSLSMPVMGLLHLYLYQTERWKCESREINTQRRLRRFTGSHFGTMNWNANGCNLHHIQFQLAQYKMMPNCLIIISLFNIPPTQRYEPQTWPSETMFCRQGTRNHW